MFSNKSLFYICVYQILWDFPEGSVGKESACIVGDAGLIAGEGSGNSLQYSCLKNPHGQRSLAGYSPWDHRELDTTVH